MVKYRSAHIQVDLQGYWLERYGVLCPYLEKLPEETTIRRKLLEAKKKKKKKKGPIFTSLTPPRGTRKSSPRPPATNPTRNKLIIEPILVVPQISDKEKLEQLRKEHLVLKRLHEARMYSEIYISEAMVNREQERVYELHRQVFTDTRQLCNTSQTVDPQNFEEANQDGGEIVYDLLSIEASIPITSPLTAKERRTFITTMDLSQAQQRLKKVSS
jgi:hypothetical protein